MNFVSQNIAYLVDFHYPCKEADRSGVMSLRQEYIGGSSAFSFNHQCHLTPIKMSDNINKGFRGRPKSLVCGVGINDMPRGFSTSMAIRVWNHMILRCCDEDYKNSHPAYKDATICEEWKLASNFVKWFNENYIDGYALDKDILVKGNKVYSPDTCCFVPQRINSIFIKAKKIRGLYPIGVYKKDNRYIARIQKGDRSTKKSLGSYLTPEEAFAAYKREKEVYIQELAQEYYDRGEITKRVYDALMRYEVDITD